MILLYLCLMNVMKRRLISFWVQLAVFLPIFLLSSFQAHGETYLDGNVIVVRQDGVFTPYLAMTDNLGCYLAVVDSLGNKVFDAHYDAWGRQHDVTVNSIGLHRGYSGHEMLDEFRLINMNARLYSPYAGRFLAPDNYVQAPENTQSFNRYSYCLNNPLKYADPSGNYAFIDDLIAAVVGGTVNVCSNLIAGEVKDFWHGLSLFGVGAVAGEATLYGSPLAGAAVMGIGNSVINQGYVNGWDKIDEAQLGSDVLMSMTTSYLGGCLGNYLSKPLSQLTKNVTNDILREAINGSLTNASTGFVLGTAFGLNGGDADFNSVLSNGLRGGAQGFAIGTIGGVGTGFQQRAVQIRNAKLQEAKPTVTQGKSEQGTTSFFENTKRSDIVNSKVWAGNHHGFPNSVEAFEQYGIKYKQKGRDGKMYQHLDIKGSYHGYNGTFEFIKDEKGIITHRFFNINRP